ncbi:hypothetical protein ACIRP0_15250 [Streptomyces sp. NPDC101733]|uniref:hypothetical protein n=1 Tax=unclassified Streptomyces TaxID=2593676 RepID=UPI0037FD0CC4
MRDDGIVPVLYLLGRRMAAEALDQDLLIRTAVDEGAEEAVRFHWDGWRMTAVSSERRWNRSLPDPDPDPRPSAPAQSPGPAATAAP